jgi:hypothetical protein
VIEFGILVRYTESESFDKFAKGCKNLRWLQKNTSPEEMKLQGWC